MSDDGDGGSVLGTVTRESSIAMANLGDDQLADYLATMATELAALVWISGESLLAFLLGMAAREARSLVLH